MKIQYDPQADALYIKLRTGEVDDTIEVSKYIYADVDAEGKTIGLEILFAKETLGAEELSSVTVNLLPLAS